jgi:arginine decarboxylase
VGRARRVGIGRIGCIAAALGREDGQRPYFEVLIVTGAPASRWNALRAEWRRLRRPLDPFVYEPVFVGSFEDAICAAMLNTELAAVIVHEGFPFRSRHDAPALRSLIEVEVVDQKEASQASALHLAQILKRIRPEIDLYLVSNGRVEDIAGSSEASAVRRVFYAVEELLELHLSILEGVQARYETPFFDNLKKYAQRPIGTFHALPIARGKSVFKSDWIRDMGEFYGTNLFLAESSATTGGLDSLLEPTGNIKKAQELAARAFGADHVFFVTNGTSTSNKMAVQALLAPGDIVIVDRMAQGLSDKLDAQVDVGNPARLDAVREGRRLPHGRGTVSRGSVHARLHQPEPAADREP